MQASPPLRTVVTHVLLWDIDGTLLTTGRAGIFAWEEAILDVCDVEADLSDFHTAGLTDSQIGALLLEHAGVEPKRETVEALLAEYARRLPEALHRRTGRVLPGVLAILGDLDTRDDVRSLLLTGNLPAGAAAKLAQYGLTSFFAYPGAFCSAIMSREEIARSAVPLVEELTGTAFDGNRAYVIGDTPHDVRCGRSIGARTIAIATGASTRSELSAAGAWLVLDELPSPADFRSLLGIA